MNTLSIQHQHIWKSNLKKKQLYFIQINLFYKKTAA